MRIERNKDGQATRLLIPKPADMHQHLRSGAMLQAVAPMVAKRFHAAIVMPNLVPPITTYAEAKTYLGQIAEACDNGLHAMLTLYLTDTLDPKEIELGARGWLYGVKYYPRGLTTNSDAGVKDPASLWTPGTKPYECLRALAVAGKVLLLHAADGFERGHEGEQDYELDPYAQEQHFIAQTLPRIIDAHPNLKISVEHLSTKEGAEFMTQNGGDKLGCSLTAHHLLLDRRDVFRGGFRAHRSWLPVIQPKEHKEALRAFGSAGHKFVWLGSDSAPHPLYKKYAECCTGGVLMAHAGIEVYVEAFEDMNALDQWFVDFACINGPHFYGAHMSTEIIELVREEWKPQPFFIAETGQEENRQAVVPFRVGEPIRWKLVD